MERSIIVLLVQGGKCSLHVAKAIVQAIYVQIKGEYMRGKEDDEKNQKDEDESHGTIRRCFFVESSAIITWLLQGTRSYHTNYGPRQSELL